MHRNTIIDYHCSKFVPYFRLLRDPPLTTFPKTSLLFVPIITIHIFAYHFVIDFVVVTAIVIYANKRTKTETERETEEKEVEEEEKDVINKFCVHTPKTLSFCNVLHCTFIRLHIFVLFSTLPLLSLALSVSFTQTPLSHDHCTHARIKLKIRYHSLPLVVVVAVVIPVNIPLSSLSVILNNEKRSSLLMSLIEK